MTNPSYHTCCSCTFTWRHGDNGNHSCADNLRSHIDQIALQLQLTTSHMSTAERIRAVKRRLDELLAMERRQDPSDDADALEAAFGPHGQG